jgi:hypothetical protein
MKIGIAIERHKNGRWTVRGSEPDSVAAAAGFAAGDEITHVGRTPAKQIRLNEEDGIDFRRGQAVRVLRSGESIRLTIPAREKPSVIYATVVQAIESAEAAQLHDLTRRLYSSGLSDGETEKLRAMIDRRRRALRRGHERELPLVESPAVGVGPTGNYHHDKEHWRRQIAADTDLSPLARQIANIIEAHYISNKVGPNYFCAWPSIKTLCRAVKRARAAVGKAIHEIEARGHWNLKAEGGRKPTLIGPVLKRSERAPALDGAPTATASPSLTQTAAITPTSLAMVEVEGDQAEGPRMEFVASPNGAAISLRPSPIAIAQGTARLRPVDAKPTGRESLAEWDAKRVAEAERQDAADASREAYDAFIKSIYANQARSGPLFQAEYDPYGRQSLKEGNYDPLAYSHRRVASSPIE